MRITPNLRRVCRKACAVESIFCALAYFAFAAAALPRSNFRLNAKIRHCSSISTGGPSQLWSPKSNQNKMSGEMATMGWKGGDATRYGADKCSGIESWSCPRTSWKFAPAEIDRESETFARTWSTSLSAPTSPSIRSWPNALEIGRIRARSRQCRTTSVDFAPEVSELIREFASRLAEFDQNWSKS